MATHCYCDIRDDAMYRRDKMTFSFRARDKYKTTQSKHLIQNECSNIKRRGKDLLYYRHSAVIQPWESLQLGNQTIRVVGVVREGGGWGSGSMKVSSHLSDMLNLGSRSRSKALKLNSLVSRWVPWVGVQRPHITIMALQLERSWSLLWQYQKRQTLNQSR